MRMSVQQAAAAALAAYLTGHLAGVFGDRTVKVEDRFPEPDAPFVDETVRRAVTVLLAGKREDTYVNADWYKFEPTDGVTGRYSWRVAACRQPIQLDAWGLYDVDRDELLAELDIALRAGTGVTLGIPDDPTRDGIVLRLDPANGHEGFCSFTFDGPEPIQDGKAAQQREFRAMITGHVDVDLVIVATSPRMARLQLQAALDGATTTYSYQPNADGSLELSGSTEG